MVIETARVADHDDEGLQIAHRWCEKQGTGWSVSDVSGQGATATVFIVASPLGELALKLYSAKFSQGGEGEIQQTRIAQQLQLKGHDCPSLVSIFDGGAFEDRLFVLMSRAPGRELEKCLKEIPRSHIRLIVDQIASAVIFLRDKDLCHRDIKAANIFISDDYTQALLLDISVTRNIYDPVGIGTDHDGQLPIVATARYSPPEYLFRLLDPGPELWHALDVYQLGALLYDLIMKESLFQTEYIRSHENRYRFAWVVATTEPDVRAQDVDQDLVFLARRALDKDWERRSSLTLEDFLSDAATRRAHSLQLLGLGRALGANPQSDTGSSSTRRRRVREVVAEIEKAMLEHLRQEGVTARHTTEDGADDDSRYLRLTWIKFAEPTTSAPEPEQTEIELKYLVRATGWNTHLSFGGKAELSAVVDGNCRHCEVQIPNAQEGEKVHSQLIESALAALSQLAIDIARAR
jgi:serine/threonine protein kinase